MAYIRCIISFFIISVALWARADTQISHVVVNQRWPWSEKVDVDFVLSGDATDVDVTAMWDGGSAPLLLGTIEDCAPGSHRLTWDPSESPFARRTLTGFTVFVTTVADSRKYLVLDLVNGGYEYFPDVPSGGWTDAYKSQKMVFRRIPAGTYTLGEPPGTFSLLGVADRSNICNRRIVTFTSDFYVGVFKFTEAQHACISTGTPGSSFKPKKISYYALRGELDEIDWPVTGYKVANDSIVAKLRAKSGGELMIDLCEEEQWEIAARAGTTTILPNGVTASDNLTTFTNRLNEISAWYGTVGSSEWPVAQFAPNGWGLYDVVGLAGEWALDSALNYNYSTLPASGLNTGTIDPTGEKRYEGTSGFRIFRTGSANYATADLSKILPCSRQMANPTGQYTCSTRFCIHLKPLGNLTFDE